VKAAVRTIKAIGIADAVLSMASANLIRIVPQRVAERWF